MSGSLFISLYYLAEFQSLTSCSASVPRLVLLGVSGIGLNVTGAQTYSKVKCYQLHLISRGSLPAETWPHVTSHISMKHTVKCARFTICKFVSILESSPETHKAGRPPYVEPISGSPVEHKPASYLAEQQTAADATRYHICPSDPIFITSTVI